MTIDILEADFEHAKDPQVLASFMVDDKESKLDARRKLENKLEEIRLQREMQEFDFDLNQR